jgi:hypothetical protein
MATRKKPTKKPTRKLQKITSLTRAQKRKVLRSLREVAAEIQQIETELVNDDFRDS